jgi:ABC-type sugar transport system ATPase subunit
VNHKLEEVFAISDRISVMRDGEMVGERKPENSSYNEIIKLMVGRDISTIFERPTNYEIGRTVLEVENLCKKGQCSEISFEVKAGEIVGMAGLVGAGRSEVAQAIFGVTEADAGTVYVDNEKAEITNPRDAIELGMAYVPEDRQHQGLFMNMSIVNNTTISTLDRFSSRGWVHEDNEQLSTAEYIDRLRIVLRNIYQPVRELSGGNQQKVVLSRWLLVQPKVIILDEPTRGIDIGAKAEVHRLMGELASRGLGILMISSELPEIVQMSDRVLVMHEGKLTANFGKEEIDSEKIMEAATGQVTAGSGTQ